MNFVIKSNDYSFICTDDEASLLEILERESIKIEYQCRHGFCGSCRVKLIEGKVDYFEEPIAFIPNNYILSCCCRIKSDLVIEISDKKNKK